MLIISEKSRLSDIKSGYVYTGMTVISNLFAFSQTLIHFILKTDLIQYLLSHGKKTDILFKCLAFYNNILTVTVMFSLLVAQCKL